IINLEPGARVISWLPAAHIAERMAHHYLPTIFAGTVTCCPNPREILTYLPQVHPTWFFAVPRIWEKLKAGLETMLHTQPEVRRGLVQPAGRRQDRDRRTSVARLRDQDRRRRRSARQVRVRDDGLPQPARQDVRGDRLGRVASHRRHRRAGRGRIPASRRP